MILFSKIQSYNYNFFTILDMYSIINTALILKIILTFCIKEWDKFEKSIFYNLCQNIFDKFIRLQNLLRNKQSCFCAYAIYFR